MADRTIYRLTEYNLNNELIKTVYHNHREKAEEEKNNNENQSLLLQIQNILDTINEDS